MNFIERVCQFADAEFLDLVPGSGLIWHLLKIRAWPLTLRKVVMLGHIIFGWAHEGKF